MSIVFRSFFGKVIAEAEKMRLNIKELREEYAMTQAELAGKLGTLQRNVSNWENGINEPDCETILKLADFFHVTVDELFGRKTDYGRCEGTDRQLIRAVSKLSERQKAALAVFINSFAEENR